MEKGSQRVTGSTTRGQARPHVASRSKEMEKVTATHGRPTTRGQTWPRLATRGRQATRGRDFSPFFCFLRPRVAVKIRKEQGETRKVGHVWLQEENLDQKT